ncbi:MAG TPA: peptide-binding protein [Gemmatimonadota bacterium]|nr:peptide-binding protein [Gemmatimonadota bacterium]
MVARTTLPLFAFLALACGGPAPDTDPGADSAPSRGGTAVVGTGSDFDAFNEMVATSALTDQVIGHILFQNLIVYDENLEYAPALADSFWVAEDGLSATFRIREGVLWHDGTPFTVDDVIWSFETSMLDETAYPERISLQYIDRAERVDDRTVRFHFSRVHAEPIADFAYWSPMPKHLLEEVPPSQMTNAEFNRNPVGNGPFRFVSWRPNESVVFEANEDYYRGRPHLDRLVFRVIPEPATAITELLSGGIDLYRNVPPSDMARIESSGAARPLSYPTLGFELVMWKVTDPLFSDERVRRAMTLATDRQAIVDGLLQGYGEVANGPAAPAQWERDETLEPWPHDPAAARRLLAEVGWRDSDGDGLLDRDGRPFRFEMITNADNVARRDVLVALQSQLREVGIDMQPRAVEFNTMVDRWIGGDFQAVMAGWDLFLRFDPSQLFETGGAYNGGGYSNPRVDELMRRASTTLDRAEAGPMWDEFQRILHREQPYTFLHFDHELWGVSRRLRGVEVAGAPNAYAPLASAAGWWIAPGDRGR